MKLIPGMLLEVSFPKYISLEMSQERSRLTNMLTQLGVSYNNILQCTYSSNILTADVDNILFYNIHQNSNLFLSLSSNGIRYEYRPIMSSIFSPNQANYKYEFVKKNEPFPRYWDLENILIEWLDVYCPLRKGESVEYITKSIKNKSGAHFFWYALKSSPRSVNLHDYLPANAVTPTFGFKIEISIPKKNKVDCAILLKAILDGSVCAFHRCGDIDKLCIQEMADRLRITENLMRYYLYSEDLAILKRKKLIEKRSGCQWAPDDHSCMFGEITINNNNITKENCKFSGKIFVAKQKSN
jgi:hypothetical protein